MGGYQPVAVLRERKILELLPTVRAIAGRLVKRLPANVQMDELISAGYVAAIHCADLYDASQAATWKSYTATRIHGAMIDYLREVDPVARSVHTRARKLREARDGVEKSTGRRATRQEIANRLGMGTDDLAHFESMAMEYRIISLDTPTGGDEDGQAIVDTIADESPINESWFNERTLRQLLKRLPEREAKIIELYILKGWAQREIGDWLGVTESRVSQLLARATKMFEQKRLGLGTNGKPLPTMPVPGFVTKPAKQERAKVIVEPTPKLILATASDLQTTLASLRDRLFPPEPAVLLHRQLQDHIRRLRALT